MAWVWMCERVCIHVCALDRNRRLGLSITNKDLIPVSLVGIFSMNVRFFLLAYVIKNKKTVIYRRPCPAFYFVGSTSLTSKNTAQGRGPKELRNPLCLSSWRSRVSFLPIATKRTEPFRNKIAAWGWGPKAELRAGLVSSCPPKKEVKALEYLLCARQSARSSCCFIPPPLSLWGWAGCKFWCRCFSLWDWARRKSTSQMCLNLPASSQ